MKDQVFPLLLSSTSTNKNNKKQIILYICIGEWPSKHFENDMLKFAKEESSEGEGIQIWWRKRLVDDVKNSSTSSSNDKKKEKKNQEEELPILPQISGRQRSSSSSSSSSMLKVKSTQDHFLSFVDFLFLVRSKITILSRYSSLKFAVYSRRCYPQDLDPKVKKVIKCWLSVDRRVEWNVEHIDDDDENKKNEKETSTIFVFDVDEKKNGKISSIREAPCEERSLSGWAGHREWN